MLEYFPVYLSAENCAELVSKACKNKILHISPGNTLNNPKHPSKMRDVL
jgi:hypothetical protein